MKIKSPKPKALLFIGFRHKTDSIIAAQELGFKAVLLTKKAPQKALGIFDDIHEGDLLDLNFIQELVTTLKSRYSVRGIISNYEHYVVVRSYLAEHFSLPACSVYSACASRNKAMQRHALAYMNENIDSRVVKTLEEARAAYHEIGPKAFLKSIAGVKSRLIFKIDSEEKLEQSFKDLQQASSDTLDEDLYQDYSYCDFNFEYPNPKTTFLLEKAEFGPEITVSSLSGSHLIWHAPSVCDVYTASDIGRDDSFLAFRILPSKLPLDVVKKAKRTTETAARILGLQRCSLFAQMILREDGSIKLIEIASRMGGYRPLMYREAFGLNLNRHRIDSVVGRKIERVGKLKHYVSMMEIFPREKGEFVEVEQWGLLESDPGISELEMIAKSGQTVGLAKYGYEPVGRFLIKGKTYEEVYERSLALQESLRVVVR